MTPPTASWTLAQARAVAGFALLIRTSRRRCALVATVGLSLLGLVWLFNVKGAVDLSDLTVLAITAGLVAPAVVGIWGVVSPISRAAQAATVPFALCASASAVGLLVAVVLNPGVLCSFMGAAMMLGTAALCVSAAFDGLTAFGEIGEAIAHRPGAARIRAFRQAGREAAAGPRVTSFHAADGWKQEDAHVWSAVRLGDCVVFVRNGDGQFIAAPSAEIRARLKGTPTALGGFLVEVDAERSWEGRATDPDALHRWLGGDAAVSEMLVPPREIPSAGATPPLVGWVADRRKRQLSAAVIVRIHLAIGLGTLLVGVLIVEGLTQVTGAGTLPERWGMAAWGAAWLCASGLLLRTRVGSWLFLVGTGVMFLVGVYTGAVWKPPPQRTGAGATAVEIPLIDAPRIDAPPAIQPSSFRERWERAGALCGPDQQIREVCQPVVSNYAFQRLMEHRTATSQATVDQDSELLAAAIQRVCRVPSGAPPQAMMADLPLPAGLSAEPVVAAQQWRQLAEGNQTAAARLEWVRIYLDCKGASIGMRRDVGRENVATVLDLLADYDRFAPSLP